MIVNIILICGKCRGKPEKQPEMLLQEQCDKEKEE